MGIKDYTISFVVLGVVILLLFTFAYDIQTSNGVSNTIFSDNKTENLKVKVGTYLEDYSNDTSDVGGIYYNTTLKEGSDSLIVSSQNTIQTKSWKKPYYIVKSAMQYAYTELAAGREQEFAYIFNAILGVIFMTGIFFFIKYLRQGEE